jgi:hypothetical protein
MHGPAHLIGLLGRGVVRGVLAAVAAVWGVTAAGQTLPGVSGPLSAGTTWQSVALTSSGLASGTSWFTGVVTLQFQGGSAGATSAGVRVALSSEPLTGTSTSPPGVIVYAAPSGVLPGATLDAGPATLTWSGPLSEAFGLAGAPLYLNYRVTSGTAVLGPATVSLGSPVPHPPGVTCATAAVVDRLPYLSEPVGLRAAPAESGAGPAVWCSPGRRAAYWRFTPARSGVYRLSTCAGDAPGGTMVSTALAVWSVVPGQSACAGFIVPQACNAGGGPGCVGVRASVQATLTAGTTYLIAVGSLSATMPAVGADGVVLSVRALEDPPSGDECAGAMAIPGGAGAGGSAWLSGPVSLLGATPSWGEGDALADCVPGVLRTVWWRLTPSSSGDYTFSTCAGEAPQCTLASSVLVLRRAAPGSSDACGPGSVLIACAAGQCGGRARLTARLTAGRTYVLGVGVVGGATLGVGQDVAQVRLTMTPVPDPAPNDDCQTPAAIPPLVGSRAEGGWTSGVVVVGGSEASGDDAPAPLALTHTAWWRFTPQRAGVYVFSTCLGALPGQADGTASSTGLAVYRTAGCPGQQHLIGFVAGADAAAAQVAGACAPRAVLSVLLEAGQTYMIAVGLSDPPAPVASSTSVVLSAWFEGPLGGEDAGGVLLTEVEPNDTRQGAMWVWMSPGERLAGLTLGAQGEPGPRSIDHLLVIPPSATGITRYTLELAPLVTGSTPVSLTLRGRAQSAGVIQAASDVPVQSASGGRLTWYALGGTWGLVPPMAVAVSGSWSSAAGYVLTLRAEAVSPAPEVLGPVPPGEVELSTRGLALHPDGSQVDTDLWLLDDRGVPLPDAGNDDGPGVPHPWTGASVLRRTLSPGEYLVAISDANLATGTPSAWDDARRDRPVTDEPGLLASSSATAPVNLSIRAESGGVIRTAAPLKQAAHEVVFVRLIISETPVCNAADLARTDGTPGPDGCVDNGDFLLFVGSFFGAECAATCGAAPPAPCGPADIARTDGTPGSDGCVDNGDFLLFVGSFFSADCAASCGR